jgi:hypothetical protein
MGDPRESSSYSVVPHLKYNTVGGVNGPLVILEDVNTSSRCPQTDKSIDRDDRSNSPATTRSSP